MTECLRVGCRMVRKMGEAGTRSLSLSGQDVGILVCLFFFSGQEMEWMMTINALQYFTILCRNTSLKGLCCGL